MDINQTVAKNVKKTRESMGVTLDQAAALTGVSRSMLAQIEKGDVNPTITVLWKIANGYKISFTSLMEEKVSSAQIIRGNEANPLMEDAGRYINYPVFAYDENKRFETYRIEIEPSGCLGAQPHLTGTEEYITVFEGSVEITVGQSTFLLENGDSLRFQADECHSYRNPGKRKAALSMIIFYGK